MAVVQFPCNVHYVTDEKISVTQVAEALMAHEYLIRRSVDLIAGSFDGIKIEKVDVDLKELHQNSPLFYAVIAELVITNQTDVLKETNHFVEKILGLNVNPDIENTVSILVLYLVFSCAELMRKKLGLSKDSELAVLQKEVSHLRGQLTGMGFPLDTLEASKGKLLSGFMGVNLQRQARKFYQPVKRKVSGSLAVNGAKIEESTVKALPTDDEISMAMDASRHDSYDGVIIEVRATDRDSTKKGWFGIPKGYYDKRIKMNLDPIQVQAEEVAGKDFFRANISIDSELNESGEYVPKVMHIHKVH